jgi:hypothetical protein
MESRSRKGDDDEIHNSQFPIIPTPDPKVTSQSVTVQQWVEKIREAMSLLINKTSRKERRELSTGEKINTTRVTRPVHSKSLNMSEYPPGGTIFRST